MDTEPLLPDPRSLLDLPFTFVQLGALSDESFAKAAKDRGVQLDVGHLEAFHRLGVLVPFLRVGRDNRLIRRLDVSQDRHAESLASQDVSARWILEQSRERQRLFDPAHERVFSRSSRLRTVGRIDYAASEYVYSHFQLLALPLLEGALPHVRRRGTERAFDVHPDWIAYARQRSRQLRNVAIALTALEPIYYSRIVGTLRLPSIEEFHRHDKWRRRLTLTGTMKWLGVDTGWLRSTASGLLRDADSIDPLGSWLEVVREASPASWNRLGGAARMAIDLRIAAELLLRYYDELAQGRRARPIEPNRTRYRGEFDTRLKPADRKEKVLTEFGLSPHPALILVVEGATERLLMPRLMEHLEVSRSRDFIAIEDAEGVDTDIAPLIAYAITPQIDLASPAGPGRGYVELTRPLTRALFVTDAENTMRSAASRERRRKVWVKRIARAIPDEYRTPVMLGSLDRLVSVDTWSLSGLSFEFAHFGDREIALAMDRVDRRPRRPALDQRVELVRQCRKRRGNLDELFNGSKVDLADELWPVLAAKVDRAIQRKTERRIPIVRVLDRALDLAAETHGHHVALEY